MTYVVLDTNILVSALYSGLLKGKPAELLDLCMAQRYAVVYTQEILSEYEAVLMRPKFGFDASDVRMLLSFFEFKAHSTDPLFDSLSRPQCADPDDQKFYDAAMCWDALLVTGNKKHFPNDKRILTPAEFFDHRIA